MMNGKKRGLFGAQMPTMGVMPGDQPDYGMGDMPMGRGFPVEQPQAQQGKPGLGTRILGQGWEGKLAAVGGMLAGNPNAVGDYHQMQEVKGLKEAEAIAAQQRAESERLAARGEYAWKSEYDRANPKAVNNDTVADYEFIKQNLGDEAAAEFLKNKANPPVHRVGPDGQFYRVDVGGQGASASPVNITEDMWNSGEPVGGPQSQSAGGFRP